MVTLHIGEGGNRWEIESCFTSQEREAERDEEREREKERHWQ